MAASAELKGVVECSILEVKGTNDLTVRFGDSLKGYSNYSVSHCFDNVDITIFSGKFAYLQIQKKVHQFVVQFFDENGKKLDMYRVDFCGNDEVKLEFSEPENFHAVNISIPIGLLSSKSLTPAKVLINYQNQKVQAERM